ncbi:hypothetical protein V6N13_130658 [Hibiscus sabdariffa]
MGFKGHEIKISAPADGIHVQRSSDIDISQSLIDTSDGRISIEQGNSHVTITSMSCGPDHGIKCKNEGDVSGLVVGDCSAPCQGPQMALGSKHGLIRQAKALQLT